MSRFHTHEWDFLPEQAFRKALFKRHPATFEGGKGSSAPPPDPALVQAQINSMNVQNDAISQLMSNSNALLPLQQQQMQLGIKAGQTAYDQSQEDRAYALGQRDKLTGIQDQIVDQANDFNLADRSKQLIGQANADVNQAFDTQAASQTRAQERMGVNPSSGAAQALSSSMGLNKALATVGADNNARQQAKNEQIQLLANANNVLSGAGAAASGATAAGAQYGNMGLGTANAGLAGMNSGLTAASSAAGGLGSNAAGMYGAQANYSLGQQKIDNDSSAAVGSLVGTVAIAF